jgi:hypothetical protein
MDHTENTARTVDQAYLLRRCLAIDVLLSRALAPEGMYIPSCYLAMDITSHYKYNNEILK